MAAKHDAAVLRRIRKLRDDWMALPPGDARIAAIRDYMLWVSALLQEINVHSALAEIALHAAAGVTGGDREARRDRVLKGYPAMLAELRLILPTAETDLFIGDLLAMDAGRAPIALYPRVVKQTDDRRVYLQEQCVLRAEYDAGVLGVSRKKVLDMRNIHGKPALPLSRLNRWALRMSKGFKQLHYDTGKKVRNDIALSEQEQKLCEAIQRYTLDELIHLAIVAGGQAGGRPRHRSPPEPS